LVAALLNSASLWARSVPLSVARSQKVLPAGDKLTRAREFEDTGTKVDIHQPQIDKGNGTDSETRSEVAVTPQGRADPPSGEARVVIGQPGIFWHNGQWQTYNDGVWAPYGKPMSNRLTQPRSKEDAADSGPGIGDPGIDSGAVVRESETRRRGSDAGIGTTTIGVGQPNDIGQSTSGIGELNVGIGQSTIGLGQPNDGIGQTTIGIGQPTIGIGQPTIGIGQPAIGIGQPTIGIGQPNTIDQTTLGIGAARELYQPAAQ